MEEHRVTICLVVFAAFFPGIARAQSSLSTVIRRTPGGTIVYSEGPGFRLGTAPLTLHPGVDVDIGGDSNVLYGTTPVGAGLLRVRARLDLATLPPQSFENDNSSSDPKLDFRL